MVKDQKTMLKGQIRDAIVNFLREEDGPTAVEYAVMIGLILAVCIGSVNQLADNAMDSFDESEQAISGSISNN